MTARRHFLPSRSDFKGLFRLAGPIVVIQLGLIGMGVVDTIMVGHVSPTPFKTDQVPPSGRCWAHHARRPSAPGSSHSWRIKMSGSSARIVRAKGPGFRFGLL
jgi:Na+-driven multidrug efflux pump